MTHLRPTLVLVGHGMVGHRFVQAGVGRARTENHDIVVLGEEPRPADDRVAAVPALGRLMRTSAWIESLDGGLDRVREAVVDDSLDEWHATLEDPHELGRFVSFVNAPDTLHPPIPSMGERGQIGPADRDEPLVLAATIPVGAPADDAVLR